MWKTPEPAAPLDSSPRVEEDPPAEVAATIAALFADKGERPEVRGRNLSIPKDRDDQWREVRAFLGEHYPPTRIGAGAPQCVVEWMGRIPLERAVAAVREIRLGRYRNGEGPERAWGELEPDVQKRVIQGVFNGMLRTRAS